MAHRRQRSRRALHLTTLLAMVSTSSAVNLSQFQLIISNSISKSCIRAYQTEIEGCNVKDFTSGKQCSAPCVKGLQQEEDLIQEACGDLNISHRSLLGIALSGDLVDTLCPGLDPTTTVTTTVHPSSTKGGFSTIVTAPTSFPTDTTRTTEKITSTTSSEKTSTSTSTTSTSDQSTTTQPSTTQETSTTLATTTATESITDTTSAQNTAQPTTPSESSQSTSSDDSVPTPFFGGTPFDPLPPEQGLGSALSAGYGKEALVVAICAALLMLW
ncbi:uncharacterized protein F4812DRAFT_462322 [Daldinia caldariorum]|uniref:uncharacterized protein n=1 Tax=Daldinia caldariorum TaxID=326644 RepID=UPI0020073509|nr:uncharacterized protein F4812DRAFT_462322 [Daldinia caldariorum]KAI1465002.1 hypothetical protein F4812DRAFT_462322 [Daldinia caldariorum]